jgi:thiol-disulfide isomerase/thioredoxin
MPFAIAISSTEGQLTALTQEVDDAYATYTSTSDTSGTLWDAYRRLNDVNLPKIFELASQDPASEASFEAFAWIVTNRRIGSPSLRPFASQSLKFLRDFHAIHSDIGEICRKLGGTSWEPMDKAALEFLRAASESNPDRNARGYANLALGQMLKGGVDAFLYLEVAPPATDPYWLRISAEYEKAEKTGGIKRLSAEAQQTLEIVLAKYADVPTQPHRGSRKPKATLGAQASAELYELNHLVPGQIAPEISGEDLDGHPLRLSEYRGKIVVLHFWASWCGACMQMIPLLSRLAEKFREQRFVIVGVNGDGTRGTAKQAMQTEHMTWRSFWNEDGPTGAIPDQWNIHGWPTVYVLDPAGVIRLRFLGYGGNHTTHLLNSTIERLFKESQPIGNISRANA